MSVEIEPCCRHKGYWVVSTNDNNYAIVSETNLPTVGDLTWSALDVSSEGCRRTSDDALRACKTSEGVELTALDPDGYRRTLKMNREQACDLVKRLKTGNISGTKSDRCLPCNR